MTSKATETKPDLMTAIDDVISCADEFEASYDTLAGMVDLDDLDLLINAIKRLSAIRGPQP